MGMEFLENGVFVACASSRTALGGSSAWPRASSRSWAAYAVGSMLMMLMAMAHRGTSATGTICWWRCCCMRWAIWLRPTPTIWRQELTCCAAGVQGLGGGAFHQHAGADSPAVLAADAPQGRAVAHHHLQRGRGRPGAVGLAGGPLGLALGVLGGAAGGGADRRRRTLAAAGLGKRQHAGEVLRRAGAALRAGHRPATWSFSRPVRGVRRAPERLAIVILIGVLLLGLFGIHQWKHDEPLLHLRDLRIPAFWWALRCMRCTTSSSTSATTCSRSSPSRACKSLMTTGWLGEHLEALISLLVTIGYIKVAGKLTHKRALMMAGCIAMAGAAFWLSQVHPDGADGGCTVRWSSRASSAC